MGNWLGTIRGKGQALPSSLNTTTCQGVSLETSIVSGLLAGGLRTHPNKVAMGGWSAFVGWSMSSPSKMSLAVMYMNSLTACSSSLTFLGKGQALVLIGG